MSIINQHGNIRLIMQQLTLESRFPLTFWLQLLSWGGGLVIFQESISHLYFLVLYGIMQTFNIVRLFEELR